jgi:hypothetical protein
MMSQETNIEVCIVIPAYNEAESIAKTIAEYKEAFPTARVVVIDNNSTDDTSDIARMSLDPARDLLLFEPRQGKGMAIKRGLSRLSADVYIMTDGDQTYPATDALRLFRIMLDTRPDMVVGDRVSAGAYDQQNKRLGHGFGNRLLTNIISRLSGQTYNDVLSGLRIMSRPFVTMLDIRSSGFQLETEMNVIAAHLRADVLEVPIGYRQRGEGSHSKLNTLRDGARILMFAVANWVAFLPMQPFLIVAGMAFMVALAFGARVISVFVESGYTAMQAPGSAIAAAAAALLAMQALFTGVTLRQIGRNSRRQDIAIFLEARRQWNTRLDAAQCASAGAAPQNLAPSTSVAATSAA